jgi:hypothetical protein
MKTEDRKSPEREGISSSLRCRRGEHGRGRLDCAAQGLALAAQPLLRPAGGDGTPWSLNLQPGADCSLCPSPSTHIEKSGARETKNLKNLHLREA